VLIKDATLPTLSGPPALRDVHTLRMDAKNAQAMSYMTPSRNPGKDSAIWRTQDKAR
jgi:hypothetical protein